MTQVNLYEAKAELSKLIERAAKGEDIVIAKNGKPVAVLVALEKVNLRKREFGFLKGQASVPSEKDWKELDAEVRQLFAKSARQKF